MSDQLLLGVLGRSPTTGDEYDRFTVTLITLEDPVPTPPKRKGVHIPRRKRGVRSRSILVRYRIPAGGFRTWAQAQGITVTGDEIIATAYLHPDALPLLEQRWADCREEVAP